MAEPYRVVVLVSGSGSNLQSLIDSVHRRGGIEIVRVVSSKDGVLALERAERAGIPTVVVPLAGRDREERDADGHERERQHCNGTAVEVHAAASVVAVTRTRQGAFLST